MFKKLIEKELSKVIIADLSNYNSDSGKFFIPRYRQFQFKEGYYYIIELSDKLLVEDPTSTLAANWNSGRIPPFKYMKACVDKVLGKMIKVTGLGYNYLENKDLDKIWEGWLPIEQLRVFSVLGGM